MESSWYKDWIGSPFYDKLYADREQEASEFVSTLIGHLSFPAPARILQTGCGRGNYCRQLHAAGFDVTGVDIDAARIDEARKTEADNLHFFLHDIRLPFWGNYFDFAIDLFTSFGHFKTRREHDAAIRTIANSLKPGGSFIIDYLNVHYAEDRLVHKETKTSGNTLYEINRWDDPENFYKKIRITDPSLPHPVEYTEATAKFSLGDFTDMLSFQGLQIDKVYGDYQFNTYDIRKTPRLILIAKKKITGAEDKEKRIYSDGRKTDPLT